MSIASPSTDDVGDFEVEAIGPVFGLDIIFIPSNLMEEHSSRITILNSGALAYLAVDMAYIAMAEINNGMLPSGL